MQTQRPARHITSTSNAPRRLLSWCFVAIVAIGIAGEAPAGPEPGLGEPGPDAIADHLGGIAARLFDADGRPIPGHVFLLIGPATATDRARVYDTVPYRHDSDQHPDTVASNVVANQTVRTIAGSDVEIIDMTSASGGGSSGGLTRAIAYLNVVSDGEFTGDLRIAATGQLSPRGYLGGIDHIDAKTVAADLADADVLFSPTPPTSGISSAHGARTVGEFTRAPGASGALNDPDRLGLFRQWGASRSDGMDIVDARHLIDVSSYLCGTGSAFACEVTEALDHQAHQRHEELTDAARAETERLLASGRRSGSAG
ncbi:MAG TPA: hypothetical protein VK860_11825 [Ilumatobacteraceae bacterium]|nr:hypothetical protein [Ilumatobacteraceae bacterium]